MIKKIKSFTAAILVLANFGLATTTLSIAFSTHAAAQSVVADFKSDACSGVNQVGANGCGKADSTISNLMRVALQILSIAAGFIAVVMVIIAAIKFMTASGDASQIASARQALIYALAGVVVATMAQILIHFVIGEATTKIKQ